MGLIKHQKAMHTRGHDKRISSLKYHSSLQNPPSSAEGVENICFLLSNSNLTPDINLAYSLIPGGTSMWNMEDAGSCTMMQ